MSTNKPLRRTRGDLIATAVITTVCLVALLIAYFTAPIRQDHLSPAAEELTDAGALAAVPDTLTESFTLPDTSPQARPLIVNGVIITYSDGTITGTTPDGTEQWTYKRSAELCGMAGAWGKVVAVYRTKVGCGDVVGINALTGQYANTRSAGNTQAATVFSSNDRVGILGIDREYSRTELWRSDLVRTVEYGDVKAPQEPDMQPHPGCTLSSALTRTELLAITETCEDGTWLRFQDTTPEDSRKPEMHESVSIPEGAYLVAISQDGAAVYDPAASTVTSYSQDGAQLHSSHVPASNLLADSPSRILVPQVADLPHNMTYFDGHNLLLLDPSELAVTTIYQGALGTGVGVGDRLLYPTAEGVAIADWNVDHPEHTIPVDRAGYSGPVALGSAGATIVEKRGDTVVVLDAS